MRMVRWAAELATSADPRQAELGIVTLAGLAAGGGRGASSGAGLLAPLILSVSAQ